MKAITVEPRRPGTTRLEEIAEPDAGAGSVLVVEKSACLLSGRKRLIGATHSFCRLSILVGAGLMSFEPGSVTHGRA